MKLLIATVDALPKIGGISLMTHAVANDLVALGHAVVVLGPSGTVVPGEYVRHYELLEDVESRLERRTGPESLIEDARICRLFQSAIDRNGIERVLLMHPFYYAVGALDACRLCHVPCSVYFHGTELRSQLRGSYPNHHAQLIESRKLSTLRERLFYTIGCCDEILVNSTYTASLFEGFTIKPAVRATGCGIAGHELQRELDGTPSYDSAARAARRDQFGLGRGPCVGYVGRLVPNKRVDRLLGICRASQDFCALIVGDGPCEADLRSQASSWGVASRVRFLGRVPEADKWDALRSTDFGCLLSEPDERSGAVEGFGIALLESAAAGAVPVSSGTGGMVDVVAHHSTGLLVPPWDVDAAQVLAGVFSNEAMMRALADGARAQLAERYTWEAVARRMVSGWGA